MAESFVFYRSFRETINMIPSAEQREQMFQALLTYGLDEIQPKLEYPLDAIFNQMMESIKGAKKRYEKQTTYGKRGGAPKGNQNAKNHGAPKGNQNAKKQTKTNNLNDNKNVNDNVNDNDNDNYHLHDNNAPAVCASLKAAQSSVRWEVIEDKNGKPRFIKHEYGGGGTT